MRFLARYQQITLWLAVLAISLGAIFPPMARAMRDTEVGALIEICTARGVKWIAAGSGEPAQAPGDTHLTDHCPGCPGQGHAWALLLPPGESPVPLALPQAWPLVFSGLHPTPNDWLPSQPRAPPVSHAC